MLLILSSLKGRNAAIYPKAPKIAATLFPKRESFKPKMKIESRLRNLAVEVMMMKMTMMMLFIIKFFPERLDICLSIVIIMSIIIIV